MQKKTKRDAREKKNERKALIGVGKVEPPMKKAEFASEAEKEAYNIIFVKKGRINEHIDYHGLLQYREHGRCEVLIKYAIENGFTGKFMEAAVDGMVACQKDVDYQSWSHAVCHLFESPQPFNENSIYNTKRADLIKKLIDESVEGAIECHDLKCMDRTLGGITLYNVITKINDPNGSLPLMFESLRNEEFVNLLKDLLNAQKNYRSGLAGALALCTAQTKRELELSYDSLEKIYNAPCDEKVKGVYVDVDGTLIVDGKLNLKLVKRLKEYTEAGKTVRAFTGADPNEKEGILEGFAELKGVLEFPVLPKSQFKGKLLEVVIDDSMPEIQGFGAEEYMHPGVL